jgi:hypothetical protein
MLGYLQQKAPGRLCLLELAAKKRKDGLPVSQPTKCFLSPHVALSLRPPPSGATCIYDMWCGFNLLVLLQIKSWRLTFKFPYSVSRWDRLLLFAGFNLGALACFVICFALFPYLIVLPTKFAIL